MTTVSIVAGPRLHLAQRIREVAANTPAAYFGIVLGLSGLGGAWRAAALAWHLPTVVGEAVYVLAGAVWAVLVVLYALKAVLTPDKLAVEAAHAVQCCFIGLAGVATMLVASGLIPYSAGSATVLFGLGFLFTLGFAVWRTGGLWQGGRDHGTTTAVLYLPTVAGSFVSATGRRPWATRIGVSFAFGAGLFSWLAMESVLLHRLLTGPEKPVALRPTLGIQLAPAPVGAVAYLSVAGRSAGPLRACPDRLRSAPGSGSGPALAVDREGRRCPWALGLQLRRDCHGNGPGSPGCPWRCRSGRRPRPGAFPGSERPRRRPYHHDRGFTAPGQDVCCTDGIEPITDVTVPPVISPSNPTTAFKRLLSALLLDQPPITVERSCSCCFGSGSLPRTVMVVGATIPSQQQLLASKRPFRCLRSEVR